MKLEVITRELSADAHPTQVLFVHGLWHAAWCPSGAPWSQASRISYLVVFAPPMYTFEVGHHHI